MKKPKQMRVEIDTTQSLGGIAEANRLLGKGFNVTKIVFVGGACIGVDFEKPSRKNEEAFDIVEEQVIFAPDHPEA